MWCTGQASAMSHYAERLFPGIRKKQEKVCPIPVFVVDKGP